jgi:biotin transporter BioY
LFPHSPTPYIALMLIGFAVGILGHLMGARWLVAAGVALIALGALLLPLAANLTTQNKPAPIEESRGDSGE